MKVHYRYYRVPEKDHYFPKKSALKHTIPLLRRYIRKDPWRFKPSPFGGAVRVTLRMQCGRVVTGESVCSLVDRFNYAKGRGYAYDDAMEKLAS